MFNKSFIFTKACSSVDRASDSDSESRGFDSLHAYLFINFLYKRIRFYSTKWFKIKFNFGADLVLTFKN